METPALENSRRLKAIDPLCQIKEDIATFISSNLGISLEQAKASLAEPRPGYGDIAITCQKLAGTLKKNPAKIASDLALSLIELPFVASTEEVNGFCNIRLDTKELVDQLTQAIIYSRSFTYGLLSGSEGSGKRSVIEFSSPNAARTLGFHHLRGTSLGAALSRLYEARGFEVIKVNYLGDFGHNLGLLLWKLDSVSEKDALEVGASRLQQLYVEANQDEEKNPEGVKAGAREWISRLNQKDEEAERRYKLIVSSTTKALKETYARLGITFDEWQGEKNYVEKGREVSLDLLSKGVAKKGDDGTIYVPGENGKRPIVLLTSRGTTTYESRDIAALLERYERFDYDRSLYLTDVGQRARFEALIAAAGEAGFSKASGNASHIGFGQMKLAGEKAKTREGKTLSLDEVLDEATERARGNIRNDDISEEDKDRLAQEVGIGAVLFSQLAMRKGADFDFDLDRSVSFQGQTAPRIQYSYARTSSIFRKANCTPEESLSLGNARLLDSTYEHAVALSIAKLPEAAKKSLDENDTSFIADALLGITDAWGAYQTAGKNDPSLRILADDKDLRSARLRLAATTLYAIRDGLSLLGIASPERM
jgi:arginyl-tRNA synthetase